MTCPVCQQEPATVGVLCEACLAELLVGTITMTLEQVELRTRGATDAALVDPWGRLQPLDRATTVGRSIADGEGLAILARTVSRRHATIELAARRWSVIDLRSTNGTWVEEERVDGRATLHHGDRVRFGQVAFYFVEHATAVAVAAPRPRGPFDPLLASHTLEVPLPALAFPARDIELHEPTGGGGGVVAIDGAQVQLTLPQFELIAMLVARMRGEIDAPAPRRGFVHAAELARSLSFDSPAARDEHVRQLVRRVRRTLHRAGIGDVIECKYGVGYRLRFMPRIP